MSTNYDNTCAICGKPIVGVVHCRKSERVARDYDELRYGNRVCCSHCYKCPYHEHSISIARCMWPKKAAKKKKKDGESQ